jgi:hypothetical protein
MNVYTINLELTNNNSIQFYIIYVLSQQLQGQLQTQHSIDTGSHVKGKHNIKTRGKLQTSTGERRHINIEKVNKPKQRLREIHKERNN